MKLVKILGFSYLILLLSFFIYSFTQVDLSLTLSQNSIYQAVEKALQHVGFFQRPFSATIFLIILILFFTFYFSFLYLSKKGKISVKNVKILTFLTFIVLVFSYNAFSYDLFNYIFDAKILTFYHLNPYLFKPLDFSSDPMLSFMRWTHRTYPYGPSWLVLTVPLSFIGSNVFIFTFFLFKLMLGFTYLGCVFLIYKISNILFTKDKIFNTIFFALNPLVIIEGLVSSHNDFPLIFFALLAIYFWIQKKKTFSVLSLFFSIGVKYLSFILIPVFGYVLYLQNKKKNINWEKVMLISIGLSIFSLFAVTYRTTFQPWYLIFPLSLASFISKKTYILFPSIIASLFSATIYVAYVLFTDYSPNYQQIISNIEWVGLGITVIFFLFFLFKESIFSKR